MAIRLSGLASGMDTESIVTELMRAQRLKTTKIQNRITNTEWKQEKWKALNSKIYSFYTGSLSKFRMQGTFNTKSVTSTGQNKVAITADTSAPGGTHLLKVKQLASGQYVTSGVFNEGVTSSTKLSALGFDTEIGTTITINGSKGKTASLDVGESTTISDFVNACKSAGLYANFDANQKRLFISSNDSGLQNSFSITTSVSEEARDRNDIRDFLSYGQLGSSQKSTVDSSLNSYLNATLTTEDKAALKTKLLEIKHSQVRNKYSKDYIAAYKADQPKMDQLTAEVRAELEKGLKEGETLKEEVLTKAVDAKISELAAKAADDQYKAWEAGAVAGNVFKDAEISLDNLLKLYTEDNEGPEKDTPQTNVLSMLKLDEITKNADGTLNYTKANMEIIDPSDAIIEYNGVEIKNSSNTVKVNGLTFTLNGVTAGLDTPDTSDDETIRLTVTNDTKAVYDSIKSFIKTYNELIKEMNENYYATSAKGYDPLTDEEKETMTDDQIEKWETKIKDSLLRRDDTLASLVSSMRTNLSASVKIDGKSYSLSSLGIRSLNYTEKGVLHIDGDQDDSITSSFDDKLMKALTEEPEKVMGIFNKLAGDLYKDLTQRMSGTSLRSALTLYNDKEMSKSVTSYKESLKKLEDKLTDMENRYYKQFTAMESAMAKMNSQSASLASMLGMNQK